MRVRKVHKACEVDLARFVRGENVAKKNRAKKLVCGVCVRGRSRITLVAWRGVCEVKKR